MEKKYVLTDNFIVNVFGIKLFQIKCIRKIKYADIGDLGGYVESERNLSQEGDAWVSGNAKVFGNAKVYGNAKVSGNAWVSGDAWVSGNAWVFGNAKVSGNAEVFGNAKVYGNAKVSGDAEVYGDAEIDSNDKHCGFDCFGSANRHTHAYLTKNGNVEITCGCFRGSIEEFEKKVEETHSGTIYETQYKAIINVIKIKFGIE